MDRSLERNARHDARDRGVVCRRIEVSRLHFHGQRGAREIGKRQRRCHLRKTDLDRPPAHDIHAPPRAHVVVRRRRVPVDPAHRQARPRIGRMHAQCEGVDARVHPTCHVELMHGIGAGDGRLFGDQVPIQPNIGARDHAVDTQQRACFPPSFGQGELGAIPPGNQEHVAAGIGLLDRTQVVAVEHVLVRAILQAAPPSPSRGRSPGTSRRLNNRQRRLRRRFAALWRSIESANGLWQSLREH